MSMFRSTSLEPDFEFTGEYHGYYFCRKTLKDKVLLTLSDTPNRDIKLINIYVNGVRRTGARYRKDKLGIFEMDILLNRIYWDYVWREKWMHIN